MSANKREKADRLSIIKFNKEEESIHQVEDIVQRLVNLLEHQSTPDEMLIREFETFGGANENSQVAVEVTANRANRLLYESKFCEAILIYEKALTKFPTCLTLQMYWQNFCYSIGKAFQDFGTLNPEHAEIGRAYDKLNELGLLSFGSHLVGLRYFVVTEQWERASTLAIKLLSVAPGLKAAKPLVRIILNNHTNDILAALIEDKGAHDGIQIKQQTHDKNLGYFLLLQLKRAQQLVENGQFSECLEFCRNILPKNTAFDLTFLDFYFLEAVCLDNLGRVREALDSFLRISQASPKWIKAHRSLSITLNRFLEEAVSFCTNERKNPLIKNYFNILTELYFVPNPILEAYLNLLCSEEDKALEIEALVLNRANLYPYDNATIVMLMSFGHKTKNHRLIEKGHESYEAALQLRPWDLELMNLVSEKKEAA